MNQYDVLIMNLEGQASYPPRDAIDSLWVIENTLRDVRQLYADWKATQEILKAIAEVECMDVCSHMAIAKTLADSLVVKSHV